MGMLIAGAFLYVSSFLARCGPSVDPATTNAIITVESGGSPYAIGDNSTRKSFHFKTKKEAVAAAATLLSKGHNLDLGLMQINSQHLSPHLTLNEVFDPCRNVAAGTAILASYYRQYQTCDPALSLFKALSAYNSGSAWRGPGYVNRILNAAGVSYRVFLVEETDQSVPEQEPQKRQRSRRINGDKTTLSPFFWERK